MVRGTISAGTSAGFWYTSGQLEYAYYTLMIPYLDLRLALRPGVV